MQIEATGKSVELAIQNGLLECGMKREEVEIKVVEEGGLFKKAKVILTWGEEKKEEPTEEIKVEEEEAKEETTETVDEGNIEEKVEEKEKPKRIVDTKRLEVKGKEFLLGLVKLIDENATVDVTAGENEINFSVNGENLGKLIGFHGDCLQSLQVLMSGLKEKGEGIVRIFVDVAGYKQNKNQGLIDLANKVAEQAIKIERNIHLDPMNAYDRRIIHTTLQGRDDVTTESTGEGDRRHVVVKPTRK